MIRCATIGDANSVVAIYNYYIENTIVTFIEQAISAQNISDNISTAASDQLPYMVYELDGVVLGYAYASKWQGRCAYRYSVEVTVYLAVEATGQGIGSALYQALFRELEKRSYHVALAGIALPNDASIVLHEKFGMRKVAHFEEVGFKFGKWVDVGYWQKTFV